MSEVIDRVPTKPGRVKLTKEDGSIEYVTTERADEPTEPGTPLNKALFDKIMPSGLICMWSGTKIPAGWLLCDGTNGTPDLRNRFIVGAGDEYAVGDTGGEKEHTLTVDEMPSHTHILDWWESANSNGYKTTKNFLYAGSDSSTGLLHNNRSKAAASGTDTITADISYVGGSEAHENRPPYYALAYIIKA